MIEQRVALTNKQTTHTHNVCTVHAPSRDWATSQRHTQAALQCDQSHWASRCQRRGATPPAPVQPMHCVRGAAPTYSLPHCVRLWRVRHPSIATRCLCETRAVQHTTTTQFLTHIRRTFGKPRLRLHQLRYNTHHTHHIHTCK